MDEPQMSLFLDDDDEDFEATLSFEARQRLKDSSVFNLDWTTATVLSQFEGGAIDLQPQYQRRDAWTVARKSKLIESLILGLPVPPVVLAERPEARGSFIVLDGKQRLTTLAQFAGLFPSSQHNRFALRDLPLLPELDGITYEDIKTKPDLEKTKFALLNQPLKTAIWRGWQSEELLHIVFHRLNSQVVPLSPQELRQALVKGPFMAFLNQFSAESGTMRWLMNSDQPDFRMRDSEWLLRLLGLTKYRAEYRGDLQKFLDKLARLLSANWDEQKLPTEESLRQIEGAIEAWGKAVGRESVARKYVDGKYEPRLNRAVLDAQVFAALDPTVAATMAARPDAVRAAFEKLMSDDDVFRRAVEATTKKFDSVIYRMDRLRELLRGL